MNDRLVELLKQLDTVDKQDKPRIIEALSNFPDEEVVDVLIKELKKSLGRWEKRFVTSYCVRALGKIGSHKAQDVLMEALDSHLFYVKADAAESLGRINPDEKAVEKMACLLNDTVNEQVQKKVVDSLGKSKSDKAVEPLSETLVSREASEDLKENAIQAIGIIGMTEGVSPLMNFYYEEANETLKKDIINALSQINSFGSVEFLIQALTDENKYIRACAAAALGELRNKKSEYALKNLLTDSEIEVRKSAAKALGMIIFLPK